MANSVSLLTPEERASVPGLQENIEKIGARIAQINRENLDLVAEKRNLHHRNKVDQTEEVNARLGQIEESLALLQQEKEKLFMERQPLHDEAQRIETLLTVEAKIEGEIRPILEFFERLAGVAPNVVMPVVRTLISTALDMGDALEPELQRGRVMRAQASHAQYQAFLDAGFDPQQGMGLLLAGIKPTTLAEQVQATASAGGTVVTEGRRIPLTIKMP